MVWIHGGRFEQGEGGGCLYRGDTLANTSEVVVVSMNYRLGVLGFLVTGENDKIQGNFGKGGTFCPESISVG